MQANRVKSLRKVVNFTPEQRFFRRILTLWERLVSPSITIRQADLRRQSRLLAAMLAAVIVLGGVTQIIAILFAGYAGYFSNLLTLLFIFLLGIAFGLNRIGRFVPAAWITVSVLSVGIFALTYFTDGKPIDADFLTFLVLPMMFVSVFLSGRAVLIVVIIYACGILASAAVIGISLASMAVGPVSFIAMVGGLVFAITRHRDSLEMDRQSELVEKLERLKALREIDLTITSSFDLPATLGKVLSHVLARLSTDGADFLLLDSALDELKYVAGRGLPPAKVLRKPVPLTDTLAGPAVSGGSLSKINDLEADADANPRLEYLAKQGFSVAFAVPLVVKGAVRGVLEVFNRERFEPTLEWIDFLETLGGQAAIAVESAQLFQNLQLSNTELVEAYDATLEGWAKALELRDKETEGHSKRVTDMTLRLALAVGTDQSQLVHLRRGALLHDIGKMGIPDSILLKPGALSDEDWEIMRQHPVFAAEMLSAISFLRPALEIPYYHHEKWDGTGYPLGLSGEDIPLAARIFALVDVWDALGSDRPYRKAWSEEEIFAYIKEQSGKHFDPRIVAFFIDLIT